MPTRVVLLLALLVVAAPQRSERPRGLPSPAEFPPQDLSTFSLLSEGIAKTLAARSLADAPDNPETIRLLVAANNVEGMLQALRVIVDGHPPRIPDAFEAIGGAAWRMRGDDERATRNRETMRKILDDGRRRLSELAREEAARAERIFMLIDGETSRSPGAWPDRLRRFIEQYRGTETALLAEVDLIGSGRVSQRMLDELDAFAAAHPGTRAAAKALYQKGFQWHTINTLGTIEPRNADPTARFMRVVEIVNELESGRYPQSEWVDKAPSLITGFFLPRDANIAAENVDRLIGIFTEFAAKRFVLNEDYPDGGGIGYVITSKVADLFGRKGERTAGVERTLAELERRAADPAAVRYLRGLFYLRAEDRESPERRKDRLDKARVALRSASSGGSSLTHRRALATLASLDFQEGEYASARMAFRKYATSYGASNWTWVAMLRIGQCDEALGDPNATAAAYLAVARAYAELPLARVLGHAYAARAFEAAGEFEKALTQHQRALDGWDNAFGLRYTTFVRRPSRQDDPFVVAADVGEVRKDALAPRIAQLKRSLALPGGALLERGRSLIARARYDAAAAEMQHLLTMHPKSEVAVEARSLWQRARLERALHAANVEGPQPDETEALNQLEQLAREPHDFAVTAAKIARASLLLKRGDAAKAEALLAQALTEWHERQRIATPRSGLEADVAEIRRAVFLPKGSEIYKEGRWNAFSWPTAPPPFMLVTADVRVKLHNGDGTSVRAVQAFPQAQKVLVFTTEEIALLKKMITTLGGTRRREPGHVMETPNQPVGDSMQILKLWSRLFPARPGHWGGWELETYPVITEIEFSNPERTKAAARVTIGYSGATVELEKEGGRWIAKRLTNQWIT
jgi:tetratricopeptide (TPR) repeat protein